MNILSRNRKRMEFVRKYWTMIRKLVDFSRDTGMDAMLMENARKLVDRARIALDYGSWTSSRDIWLAIERAYMKMRGKRS